MRAIALLLLAAGLLAGCSSDDAKSTAKTSASKLEKIEGSEFKRVTLTEKAVERLGIKTAPVREASVARNGVGELALRKVIPYSAVMYTTKGTAFVYISPQPLTFVRSPITVDYIEGDLMVVSEGPPVDTTVVTVGSAELYGTEKFGK